VVRTEVVSVSADFDPRRRDPEDDVRAAAAAEGLVAQDVERVVLPDGTVQYAVEAPPRRSPRDERLITSLLLAAAAVGLVSVAAGLRGVEALQGAALGAALFLVAVALTLAATRLLPHHVTLQVRTPTPAPDAARSGPAAAPDVVDQPRELTRRRVVGSLVAAVAAIGAAILVPLRGLGPAAHESLRRTAWGPGVRAVDAEGRLVRSADVPEGGVLTVFPEPRPGASDGQTVLMRLPVRELSARTVARSTADGLVAYSKVCSHAGCPVGQLQIDTRTPATTYRLLCPCHQSLFDVTDGAEPLSGPASRPLAQLPLGVDARGYVVALADFDEPVGPGWWSR
jgi:ubiquinol-cytochrome c reductase iron-sulfur subunit